MNEPIIVALIAAAPPSLLAAAAWRKGRANGRALSTDGNGGKVGPAVHRIEQSLEFVSTAVKAQGETLHAQGVLLDRGQQRFGELADMMNDQRLEQEQFVAKVSPLCDWVERKQHEEESA